MYLSIKRRGEVKEILKNSSQKDIRFICVTDGGRILGLGDLGANGAGIPIGKLELYTACAGVPPQYLLPMFLDAGTNNEQYLHDPLYLGLRETRPPTVDLFSFVDEFVEAVQEVFPKCCIHFEDWTGVDAIHLLQRYRDKYCVYNDDVQGTAAIVLAGMINATRLKDTKLKDENTCSSARAPLVSVSPTCCVRRSLPKACHLRRLSPGCTCLTLTVCWRRLAKTSLTFRSHMLISTRQPEISLLLREHKANHDHRHQYCWRSLHTKSR